MAECSSALARCVENIPIVGYLVAMCHSCAKKPAHAQRAAIKSTLGIVCCICNFPTECVDECIRYKSPKLSSHSLTSRPEWMRKYHQHTLRQICLPGSHHSTTYACKKKLKPIPMATGWSKCQDLSLSNQLRGGIRFFDLRVMSESDGEIWTHHNVVTCVNLKEVLETVHSYVTDHPTEIVGLAFDSDGKHIDWTKCGSLLNEHLGNKLIHEHMRDMLMGDIVDQGKNVFIYGIPNVACSWKGINRYWPNKEWPKDLRANMEEILADQNEAETTNLFWYKAECTPKQHMIGRSVGGVPGAAFAQCADEKMEFVEDLASVVNNIVLDILTGIYQFNFQILSTDFVQDEVVDKIIELNKRSTQHDETFALPSANQTFTDGVSSENILRTGASLSAATGPNSARRHTDQSFMSNSAASGYDKSVSVSFSTEKTSNRRGYSLLSATDSHNRKRESGSARSSQSTLTHNITVGSTASQFEMPNRKAPPLEVKETTM